MSRRRRRNSKDNNKGMSIVVFVVVFVSLSVGIYTMTLKAKRDKLIERQDILEAQLESEEQRAKDLEAYEKYMQTKKYMEEVAREKLGLVYPDEILIEPSNK